MLSEDVECMHQWVFIAKQAPHATLLLIIDLRETIHGHISIFFHQRFRDDKLLHSVLSWILKHLFSHHSMFVHGIAHLKGGIHQDTVESIQHLRVHSTHRSANNQIWFLFIANSMKQTHSLFGMNG